METRGLGLLVYLVVIFSRIKILFLLKIDIKIIDTFEVEIKQECRK